jgi:hypothetical protein
MISLRYLRESFVRKVDGVPEDAAAESPVGSGTSLLWLTSHLADAEALWLDERLGGRPGEAEPAASTLVEAIARYRRRWKRSDEILAAADPGALCPAFGGRPQVNVRWIIVHLVEETARHAGHADVLREMIDGDVGR